MEKFKFKPELLVKHNVSILRKVKSNNKDWTPCGLIERRFADKLYMHGMLEQCSISHFYNFTPKGLNEMHNSYPSVSRLFMREIKREKDTILVINWSQYPDFRDSDVLQSLASGLDGDFKPVYSEKTFVYPSDLEQIVLTENELKYQGVVDEVTLYSRS